MLIEVETINDCSRQTNLDVTLASELWWCVFRCAEKFAGVAAQRGDVAAAVEFVQVIHLNNVVNNAMSADR